MIIIWQSNEFGDMFIRSLVKIFRSWGYAGYVSKSDICRVLVTKANGHGHEWTSQHSDASCFDWQISFTRVHNIIQEEFLWFPKITNYFVSVNNVSQITTWNNCAKFWIVRRKCFVFNFVVASTSLNIENKFVIDILK